MNARETLLRMAENNAWSNLRLHRACAQLTEEEYRATRTSFFPSIRRTLEHIYLVDVYYLDALERGGRGRAMYAAPEPTFERFALLTDAQRAIDRRIVAFIAALEDDAALDQTVVVPRPEVDEVERIGDLLQHLFVHQIHHRGQAHAMLAGTTVKPPQLDEWLLASDRPRREADLAELDAILGR